VLRLRLISRKHDVLLDAQTTRQLLEHRPVFSVADQYNANVHNLRRNLRQRAQQVLLPLLLRQPSYTANDKTVVGNAQTGTGCGL